jgi:broad specificity phosphatase PhoE
MGTVVAAAILLVVFALPTWAAQAITLTWVRHAQSTANAAGIIDTTVPGPGLTALGDIQAQAVAEALKANAYDGIYVSNMVRTSLTAAPLATDLGLTPVVLPGVREINAGIFDGRGGALAGIGYALPPAAWVFGARFVPVLGGESGNAFEARVSDSVAAIHASGDENPVVFSHGATIMSWTLMTVDNPNLLLALTHPLGNTAVVVVNGNPEDGWTLRSWDGVAVDPNPGPLTALFVAVRNAVVAPQTALYDICHPPSAAVRIAETVSLPTDPDVRVDPVRRGPTKPVRGAASVHLPSARVSGAAAATSKPASDKKTTAAASRREARSHTLSQPAA